MKIITISGWEINASRVEDVSVSMIGYWVKVWGDHLPKELNAEVYGTLEKSQIKEIKP